MKCQLGNYQTNQDPEAGIADCGYDGECPSKIYVNESIQYCERFRL